jgi:GntR family transcriptional regulator
MSAGAAPQADGLALYLRIEQVLKGEILAGQHPVGTLLPPEIELCARFSVSRYTIRAALRLLSDAGLVARRQGAGTIVVANQLRSVFVQSTRSMADLLQYAADTHLSVNRAEMITLTGVDAELAGFKPGGPCLNIEGLRRDASGYAICTVRVFVAERYAGISDELGTLKGPIFARIEGRFRVSIAHIRQEVSAAVMPPHIARNLGIKPQSVGMRFRRCYSDSGHGIILTSINWHPAGHFVYATDLKRQDGDLSPLRPQ